MVVTNIIFFGGFISRETTSFILTLQKSEESSLFCKVSMKLVVSREIKPPFGLNPAQLLSLRGDYCHEDTLFVKIFPVVQNVEWKLTVQG